MEKGTEKVRGLRLLAGGECGWRAESGAARTRSNVQTTRSSRTTPAPPTQYRGPLGAYDYRLCISVAMLVLVSRLFLRRDTSANFVPMGHGIFPGVSRFTPQLPASESHRGYGQGFYLIPRIPIGISYSHSLQLDLLSSIFIFLLRHHDYPHWSRP